MRYLEILTNYNNCVLIVRTDLKLSLFRTGLENGVVEKYPKGKVLIRCSIEDETSYINQRLIIIIVKCDHTHLIRGIIKSNINGTSSGIRDTKQSVLLGALQFLCRKKTNNY